VQRGGQILMRRFAMAIPANPLQHIYRVQFDKYL
jgi:hypothetical protein